MKKYSMFVLCSILLLIGMLLTSCTVNNNHTVDEYLSSKSEVNNSTESLVNNKSWETAYNKKLHGFYVEYNERYSSPQKIYYDTYDLDGDDNPELIISEGDYHMAKCKIYSYVNSELIELERLGKRGSFSYYPKSRLILCSWTNQGHHVEKWYDIESHGMKLLCSYGFVWKEKDLKQYEINGKSVSEEEYKEYMKEHSDYIPEKDEERIELGKGNIYQE